MCTFAGSGNLRDSDYSYGKYRSNDDYKERDFKKNYRYILCFHSFFNL